MLTACKNCKWFEDRVQESGHKRYRCKSPLAIKANAIFDYYTGQWFAEAVPLCRDVNTKGNCTFYEEKK